MLFFGRIWLFQNDTLSSSLLHLLNDFFSTIGCTDKLLFDLGLFGVCLSLLLLLELFSLLLMFLILGFCLLLNTVPDGRGSSHLAINLSFQNINLALVFLNLALDGLLNLLVMLFGLFLDFVELLDVALLSIGVSLCNLGQEFFLLSSLIGCLALSDELDLVVVGLCLLLDVSDHSLPVQFSCLEFLTKLLDSLLTLSTLVGRPTLTIELNLCRGLFDLRDCRSNYIDLSFICFLEFLLNLLKCGLRTLLSRFEALLHWRISAEFFFDLDFEADWLRGCALILNHVLMF